MKFLKKWKNFTVFWLISSIGLATCTTLTLSNCASKSETANSINIYGADSIKGQLTDDTQLNAVENTGKDVTSDCTWVIINSVEGFRFSSSKIGELTWNVSTAGTYSLDIQASTQGIVTTRHDVKVKIINTFTPTTFTIYGATVLNGIVGQEENSSYSAIDNMGSNITNTSMWSLINNPPTGLTISNGTLSWLNNLSAGTYTFAIRCVSGTLTGSDLNVVLTISEIKPVPTSINVYGAPTIHGIAGQTGNIQYIATNNIGENINNAVWTLGNAPTGVSIDNHGLLSWTANAVDGAFFIYCNFIGLTAGSIEVTFNTISPIPTPSYCTIYGSASLIGYQGANDSFQYRAIDNTGVDITSSGTWSIKTPIGSGITFSSSNSGLLTWDGTVDGNFDIGFVPNNQSISNALLSVTLTLYTVPDDLSIDGPTAIAVPYQNYFNYSCKGGTISVDPNTPLPEGFSFYSSTNTLDYHDYGTPLVENGQINLISTAFSSSATNTLTINYYVLDSIPNDSCVLLQTDGASKVMDLTFSDGFLTMDDIPYEDRWITTDILFGNMDGTFDRIGDDFLYDFSSLEEIKLPRLFGHVNSISRNFLASCPALKKVDLSTLSEVNGIGSNFMSNNFSLSNIDLSPLSQVTSIGDGFMSSDFSLKSVDLSNWTKVITISSNFLNDDPALSSVNLSGFSSVLFIENDFFANDFSLKKIDLSSLNAVQGIGIMLYDCRCLTQVTLPSNNFSNRFRYPAAAQDSFHNAVNKSTCTLHGSWGSDLKNVVGSNISNWTVSS